MARILIVEDELHLAQGLLFNLEAEGHEVSAVESGEAALELLVVRRERFDAVVLDVMLPGVDGFTVAERVRAAHNYVPVLMLTARARPEDVLKGFASGADDYLPKPFELSILIARVHGLLRRTEWQRRQAAPAEAREEGKAQPSGIEAASVAVSEEPAAPPEPQDVFRFDGRTLDFGTLELIAPKGKIQLTLMEAALLRYFLQHRNRNVSRKQILEDVWGLHEDTDTRAIDNFVVRLRRYLEDTPATPRYLITVRGVGYRFALKESEGEAEEAGKDSK